MDMLIVTTESHRRLAGQYFHPTLPPEAGVVVRERALDLVGKGSYGDTSWQAGVTAKVQWALDYMASADLDEVFVLSDVDIQFFSGFRAQGLRDALGASGTDVLFQKEHRSPSSIEVNTGFYVARNTVWFRDLLCTAARLCDEMDVKNDQTAINRALSPDEVGQRWGFLPFTYYARSQGFPPRRDVVLHHANFSGSVDEKASQLRRVRRYVTGNKVDEVLAIAAEGVDFVSSGKLAAAARHRWRTTVGASSR
jgi:hypothetical protein